MHTRKHTQAHVSPDRGSVCGREWRMWDFGPARKPGGGRLLLRADGVGESRDRGSQLHPLPPARRQPTPLLRPPSLSRLRRCLPRLARGRGGARGGAGARSAPRAEGEGSWRWAPYSAGCAEPQPAVSQPLSELGDPRQPPLLTTLPPRPHAQTPGPYSASPPPPTVGVG